MSQSATNHKPCVSSDLPPDWSLQRPKPVPQKLYDLFLAPMRMIVLPDAACEKIHLTSLRAERLATVLPRLKGRCLDIGAGDNTLLNLYMAQTSDPVASQSVGVDVVNWGGGCQIIRSSDELPFPDNSFDTVSFVACLNHIPEREGALTEAMRVLKPGGHVVVTMIGRFIGKVGHAIWWYSEDKHRDIDPEEEMGLDNAEVLSLIKQAGFREMEVERFVYGLNNLFVARKPD